MPPGLGRGRAAAPGGRATGRIGRREGLEAGFDRSNRSRGGFGSRFRPIGSVAGRVWRPVRPIGPVAGKAWKPLRPVGSVAGKVRRPFRPIGWVTGRKLRPAAFGALPLPAAGRPIRLSAFDFRLSERQVGAGCIRRGVPVAPGLGTCRPAVGIPCTARTGALALPKAERRKSKAETAPLPIPASQPGTAPPPDRPGASTAATYRKPLGAATPERRAFSTNRGLPHVAPVGRGAAGAGYRPLCRVRLTPRPPLISLRIPTKTRASGFSRNARGRKAATSTAERIGIPCRPLSFPAALVFGRK